MEKTMKILSIGDVTHDVKRFVVDKPSGYEFEPGQATEVSIAEDEWADEKRPFTFTSLNNDAKLEFTIKGYPDHDGVTEHLHELKVGDELLLRDAWGAITYKGPGVFIAGGAGVTPFIAILRQLEHDDKLDGNKLLLSNKTADDIIMREEFVRMLGDDAVFTVTRQDSELYETGRIGGEFIEEHVDGFDQPFYVCGPPEMVKDVTKALKELGAEPQGIVVEE